MQIKSYGKRLDETRALDIRDYGLLRSVNPIRMRVHISMNFLKCRFGATILGFFLANACVAAILGGTGANALSSQFKQQGNLLDPNYGTWTWWTIKAYFDQPRAPDVLLLGSSQVNSAVWASDAYVLQQPVDCILHRRVLAMETKLKDQLGAVGNLTVLNCAAQGAMASDYYMIARALFTADRRPNVVIVGISPRDFIDNKLAAASATEPFRFLSPYVDTGELTAIAFPDVIARLNAQSEWALGKLGLRRLHAAAEAWAADRTAVSKHQTGNQLVNAISNSALKVKPGDWVVPPHLPNQFIDNTAEYASRYKNSNPPSYKIQLAFFAEFLEQIKRENIKVVVVGMPTLPMNRKLLPNGFWDSYRGKIASICVQHDARWLDLSQSCDYQQSDFVDTVHLNARGGVKLIDSFVHLIAGDTELARSLNSNGTTTAQTPVRQGSIAARTRAIY